MTERCTGCGSVESLEEIKAKHPQALSCCPERQMCEISDCGEEGCGECDVCQYLDFLDWAGQVAPRDIPSTIDRNAAIEAHLDRTNPHWRR